LQDGLFRKESADFCRSFNFWNRIYFRFSVTVHFDEKAQAYYVEPAGAAADAAPGRAYLARKRRIYIYRNGIPRRLQNLADTYFLDRVTLSAGDTVIDCGANIGEIGLYFRMKGVDLRYFPVEPSRAEAAICDLNNFSGAPRTIRRALWNKSEILRFFNKNDSGDSSVFETDTWESVTEVEAVTLTDLCRSEGISKIHWLKLEAEGAEPEVLEGAAGIIDSVKYISVDCGFERGKEARHTVAETMNFLIPRGFELVDMSFKRIVCLFENKNME
jgi:FkbM family methyltransferase